MVSAALLKMVMPNGEVFRVLCRTSQGNGVAVFVGVWVGMLVFVAVPVFVGVSVMVGVRVIVNVGVIVGVMVAVPVADAVGVVDGVNVSVGVLVFVGMEVPLGSHPSGGAVMTIGTLTRMVRALKDSISKGCNGTRGTMGEYIVWTRTRMRLIFPGEGMKLVSAEVPAGQ